MLPEWGRVVGQVVHSHWISAAGEGGCGDAGALFPYWSFTKTVIAICALRLAERGALDLDAEVGGMGYSWRVLLAHRSGLPDYGQVADYGRAVRSGCSAWSRERMLEQALKDGTLFAPGQGFAYSNIGYMFLREAIEDLAGMSFGQMVAAEVSGPLGLRSVRMWRGSGEGAALHWPEAARYDPGWVYHGCLIGTAADAARLLHGLFGGELLCRESLAQMVRTWPLGGALPGRPWSAHGYALGLMSGEVPGLGRVMGHSGAGPFCVNAVCHFPDAPVPVTVASFTSGADEGVAEFAAVDLARRYGGAAVRD